MLGCGKANRGAIKSEVDYFLTSKISFCILITDPRGEAYLILQSLSGEANIALARGPKLQPPT